jgi:hypothetical protein
MGRRKTPCPVCNGPKESDARLCKACFLAEKSASRVCPRCGGRKTGDAELCKSCRSKQRRLEQQARGEFTRGNHRMVPCPICHGPMHKDSPYCWSCRVKLQKSKDSCLRCGIRVLPGWQLCHRCQRQYIVVVCEDCGSKFVTRKDWDDFTLRVELGRPQHFHCSACGEKKYAGVAG